MYILLLLIIANHSKDHSFLIHAIFLVTASHLHHLHPDDPRYQNAVLEHFSNVLPCFRAALDTFSGNTDHADALMACAILLVQYSWTFMSPDTTAEPNTDAWLTMLGLYSGLTSVVLSFYHLLDESRFRRMMKYSPVRRIEAYLNSISVPIHIDGLFHHSLTCSKISDGGEMSSSDCSDASRRLILILCAMRLGQNRLETSGILLDVARCLFTWPSLLSPGFKRLVKLEDGRSQIILLYYFAAVSRLRGERFWWMRERAVCMFKTIWAKLEGKCTHCTSGAIAFFSTSELLSNSEGYKYGTYGEETVSAGSAGLPKDAGLDGEPFHKECRLSMPDVIPDI
jgi:hypothetical protein